MSPISFISRALLLCLLFARFNGLRSVQMVLPPVVAAGSSATLLCLFDLQRAPLYSVKWYRGNFEFYRFVPKDQPPKRAFPFPGLAVDLSSSSDQQVRLVNIPLHMAGMFSCEVSADAPSFTTNIAYDELVVIDLKYITPEITVEKRYTNQGYFLDANCTTKSSGPRVTLTFFINNREVANEYTDMRLNSAALHLNVSTPLAEEQFSLKCVASVLDTLHMASDIITVCHHLRRFHLSGTAVQQISTVAYIFLIVCHHYILIHRF